METVFVINRTVCDHVGVGIYEDSNHTSKCFVRTVMCCKHADTARDWLENNARAVLGGIVRPPEEVSNGEFYWDDIIEKTEYRAMVHDPDRDGFTVTRYTIESVWLV